jgi:hypothetical protein
MPYITYPGVTGVISLDVTTSVGISPATIGLTVYPNSNPATTGDLVFGNQSGQTITMRDCFVEMAEAAKDMGRDVIVVRMLDRRWKWRYGYTVFAQYNQQSAARKLVPWTVRSPYQLAYLLLDAMGELVDPANQIDLPAGLASPDLADRGPNDIVIDPATEYLGLGKNLSTTRTNPQVTWGGPAAAALADLAETYGRLVVLDPITDILRLVQVGVGSSVLARLVTWSEPVVLDDILSVTVNDTPFAITVGSGGGAAAVAELGRQVDAGGAAVSVAASGLSMVITGDVPGAAIVVTAATTGTGTATVTEATPVSSAPRGRRLTAGVSQHRDTIPYAAVVRGAPTRHQLRARVRAVGREWDGSWSPLERLSYAPSRAAKTMLVNASGSYDALATYSLVINGVAFTIGPGAEPNFLAVITALQTQINASGDAKIAGKLTASLDGSKLAIVAATAGYEFEIIAVPTLAVWEVVCIRGPVSGPRDQQNAHLVTWGSPVVLDDILGVTVNGTLFAVTVGSAGDVAAVKALGTQVDVSPLAVTVSASGLSLVITGDVAGAAVTVSATTNGTGGVTVTEVAPATFTPKGFETTAYPFAYAATSTDRLTRAEAERLARESVYRCYQVLPENPANQDQKYIPVPEIGNVANRYQIVMQSSRPEAIEPNIGEANVIDPRTSQPFSAEFYNGFAVDRPNVAYGSIAWGILSRQQLMWAKPSENYLVHNTPPRSLTNGTATRIPITFDIVDPERQVIRFSEAVYRILGQGTGMTWQPADLVIEFGAQILEENDWSPICYEHTTTIPGGAGPNLIRVYPDVQREIIGTYDPMHNLTGFRVLDADAENRARYYGAGLAATFQAPTGEAIRYDGIERIGLSGKIRQISWNISESGLFTAIGVNCETSRIVLPYQSRRKSENLPPNQAKALSNFMGDYMRRSGINNAVSANSSDVRGGNNS